MTYYKKTAALLTAILLFTMAGCARQDAAQEGQGQSAPAGAPAPSSSQAADDGAGADYTFTARDLDVGYDQSTATRVTLSGGSIVVSGQGASANGSVLTITSEGVYILTGVLDDGQVVIDASETDKVQLVFDGVSVHCADHAALFVKQADKVFITLAEGSKNTLSDGGAYSLSEEDSNVDGVIFSRADLTIGGSGSLEVTAVYKHGIVSKDDLVVTGGSLTVNAQGDALSGKDCVKIKAGTFVLAAQSDGIVSNNAEDEGRGYIYIAGGSFEITAGTDGIQAETTLRIDDGDFTVITGGGSANASVKADGEAAPGWGQWGGAATTTQTDTASAKGLKAGSEIIIAGGTFGIDSSDDAIHSNAKVTLTGGTVSIASGDDGIHADSALAIGGGTVVIEKAYEGLEGNTIDITGGAVTLTASDDGLNAAGGNDGSSLGGRPGQNEFSTDTSCYIRITGGELTVNAAGDGIDSNGNLYIDGGTIYVNGPTNSGNGALDYNGTADITGGTIVAAGSAGMAQGLSSSSSQCSILYNWSSALSSGTEITLTDQSGAVVLSYTPQKSFQSVVMSSPDLVQGQTYTLRAGSQSASVTLSSIVTSNGGGQTMGQGGGRR